MTDQEKVSGVNSRNYYNKARAFMEANETREFGVSIDPETKPQQWGAWLAYLKKIGCPVAFMQTRGAEFRYWSADRKSDGCYQVPADFPSDFDADTDWIYDKRAGDLFMDDRASIKAKPELSEQQRQAVVQRAMKGTHLNRNLDWRPGQ